MLTRTESPAEPVIELEEGTHTYRVDGVVRPSVSEIIGPYAGLDMVDWQLLVARAQLGQRVHEACDLADRGELGQCEDWLWNSYVEPWVRFVEKTEAVIVASELRCYHPYAQYAGTIDRLVLFKGTELPCVVDLKTSAAVPRTVGMQTAAYREAQRAAGKPTGRTRYCVHLPGNGDYQLHKLSDPIDLAHFNAALTMWRFMQQQRRTTL